MDFSEALFEFSFKQTEIALYIIELSPYIVVG